MNRMKISIMGISERRERVINQHAVYYPGKNDNKRQMEVGIVGEEMSKDLSQYGRY